MCELRVQFGWAIASGVTIKEMKEDQDTDIPNDFMSMKPSDYVLLYELQDRDVEHRLNVANAI